VIPSALPFVPWVEALRDRVGRRLPADELPPHRMPMRLPSSTGDLTKLALVAGGVLALLVAALSERAVPSAPSSESSSSPNAPDAPNARDVAVEAAATSSAAIQTARRRDAGSDGAEAEPGVVEVEVCDDFGQRIAGIAVRIEPLDTEARAGTLGVGAESRSEAAVSFRGLAHGRYIVAAGDEGDDRARKTNPCSEPAFGRLGHFIAAPRSVTIELTEDAPTARAQLRAQRAARLHGLVLGPNGEVGPCQVLLWSIDDSRTWETTSEPLSGEFCALVPPGRYLVTAMPSRSLVEVEPTRIWSPHAFDGLTAAAPEIVALQPGEVRSVLMEFGLGAASVSGRVVDGFGEPWAELEVVAFLQARGVADTPVGSTFTTTVATARTDQSGGFTVGPLAPGQYGITFRVPGMDLVGPGGLGEYAETISLELERDARHVDLGTCLVYRWIPLAVVGRIAVASGEALQALRITALLPSLRGDDVPRRRGLTLSPEGEFSLQVSAHKSDTLSVEVEGGQGLRTYRRELVPRSGDTLDFSVLYP